MDGGGDCGFVRVAGGRKAGGEDRGEAGAKQTERLAAPTPPMGWNSWDSYGLTVTEAQFKANARWLDQNLKKYGWRYVVVDEGWYLAHPENAGRRGADPGFIVDGNGRYQPATDRFPSAANGAGFRALAAWAHAHGLKFGLHIIRGIPRVAVKENLPIAGSHFHAADAANPSDTCAWNPDNYGVRPNAAGQAYYNSLARLYAGWGVDFLKVDCISRPYRAVEIHMIHQALTKATAATGRPIALSLSPGPTPLGEAADARRNAQMWRISNDFWDVWQRRSKHGDFPQSLHGQFARLAQWAGHGAPGHWPDADMLPLGHIGPRPGLGPVRQTRLTPDEQRTVLTLWSMARSPLIMGGNLTQMDAFTTALLTNPEVIAVDQHSAGNRPVIQTADTVVWRARPASGSGYYVAVFNLSDQAQTIRSTWKQLGLPAASYRVRDLWQHSDLGPAGNLSVALPPHASVLYELRQ